MQKQLALAKQRQQEAEDRFNEAVDASTKWKERATRAEQKLSNIDQLHADELARLRRKGDSNTEGVRALQMALQDKDRIILTLKSETDKIILQARQHEQALRDRHAQELQRKQYLNVANQKSSYEIQAEKEDLERELEDRHRRELDQLREELEAKNTTNRLAVKEREIERMHATYQRQITDLNRALTDAQARIQRILRGQDPQNPGNAWPVNVGPNGLPSDVQELQSQLQRLRRSLEEQAMYFTSEQETYLATIAKLRESEASHSALSEKQISAVELARASLEQECERLRMKWKTAQQQASDFRDELKKVRNIRPEYEVLKEKNPELLKDNTELVELRKQLLEENTTLRSERHRYVEVLAQETADKIALKYEVEELRDFRDKYRRAAEALAQEEQEGKAERIKHQKDHVKLLKQNHRYKSALADQQAGRQGDQVANPVFSDTSDDEEDSVDDNEGKSQL